MNFISLKNFKSYGTQIVSNLNPKINLIIGKNGQGKSNFFKAINFILTDRVPLNKSQYNSHLHKLFGNDPEDIAVQVYFKSQLKNDDQEIYRIQRIWKSDLTEEFKIQNAVFTKNAYQNFIQSLGLSYSNPYNIIQQGKITQITLMDQYEIFKLLQEATGVKKYEKRHNQAIGNMKKAEQQKQAINKVLKEIQQKVRVYQSKKQEFEYYNYQQIAQKLKTKQHYQQKLSILNKQISSLKTEDLNKSDNINKLKIKQKQIQNELYDINQNILIIKNQLFQYTTNQSFQEDQQLKINYKNIQNNDKKYKIQLNKIQKQKQKIKNKLNMKHNQIQKLKQDLEPYKQKYRVLTLQIQALKITKQNKDKVKSQLINNINKQKNNIKQFDNQLKKINKYKNQFKINDNKAQIQEFNKIKDKQNQINNQIKNIKIQIYQCNRNKNQLQSQCNVLTNHSDNYYLKMRKILPLLEFRVLNQVKKQKIKGVYGFLIEFLQIQPTIAFAYQIASLNKLCTLLVQDQEVCSNVIDVNRKIKGKQISILPLNVVKNQANQKKNYPKMQDCYSLLNQQWIKIKQHSYGPQFTKILKKIISNTFNKHLLVKDYDTGLKISKQYHLTCITADKQIIYSQGYLCKLGKDQNIDDRIEIYYKYAEKAHNLEQSKEKLSQVLKQSTSLQNIQLELIKKKLIIENDLRRLQQKIQEINDQKRSFNRLQQEQQQLLKKRKKYEQQIKQKQELLSKIDNKKSSVNPAQYKQLQQIYNSKLSAFNKGCQQQYNLQQQYSVLNKRSQEIKGQINQNHLNKSFQQEFKVEYVSNKQYKEQLRAKQDDLQKKRRQLQAKAKRLKDQQQQNQKMDYELNNQINIIEEEILFYERQLHNIGNVEESLEEIQEKSNSFSVSFMRNHQERKKKIHPFTTKQKLFFNKIASFRQQMDSLLKQYNSLQQVQRKTNQLIQEYEKDKDLYLGQMFKTFQKQFTAVFKFITLNGKADIRLKKNADKSKGLVKYKNSISIFVSFERQREARNWSQFSGGQKTVIAFCLLVALQKCQPAPFYIFDEIDSALDPVYLQRIVHFIKQQCNHSQYFITSFKKEMMRFSQDICNYYHVKMNDRLSKIQRISQKKAQQLIDLLVG